MINGIRPSTSSYPTSPPPMVYDRYTLQPGETLDGLADRFGLEGAEREEFRRINPQVASSGGIAGQYILVPRRLGGVPSTTASTTQPLAQTTPSDPVRSPSTPTSTPIQTQWTNGYNRGVSRQNTYNTEIQNALERWPTLDPLILKSILAQESSFQAYPKGNVGGYAGVAQLGIREAHSQGLKTGSSRMRASAQRPAFVDTARDERLNPAKAIPAAAGLLRQKARLLNRGVTTEKGHLKGFNEMGFPKGDDYWRFVSAAYNGGEGTVLLALNIAYGGSPPPEVRWEDLVASPNGDVTKSPLYQATMRVFPGHARSKFNEIRIYARDVVLRARQ